MGSFAAIAQTRRTAEAVSARSISVRSTPQLADADTYRPTAAFFGQLRQYLGLTREQAAVRLQTHPSVIAALETGTLSDLPPWWQTHHIVSTYTAMAGIYPAPALHSLELCYFPAAVAVQVSEPENEPDTGVTVRRSSRFQFLASIMPRRWPLWRIAVVAGVLMVAGLGAQSSMLEAAVSKLPAPVGDMVRHAKNALLFKTTRTFEGMTWIDVDNPRTRRADKLPIKRR